MRSNLRRWGEGLVLALVISLWVCRPIWAMGAERFGGMVGPQTDTLSPVGTMVPYEVLDSDTVPFFGIRQVLIFPERKFKSRRQYREYQRMIRNLKIVYPYALEAKTILEQLDSAYASTTSLQEQRKFSYKMEKKLHRQFEQQIRNLTYSQGHMLIKLINRETGLTSYEIIKRFRGSLSAGLWQGVAKLFSSDLKSTFKPEEEDKILEELIILYENGQL